MASSPQRKEANNPSADALLNATSALMTERNSVDVTFVDIAQRSGVNSALIRYHFGSKTGLFKALLERDAGGTFDNLDALVNAEMSAVEKMRHHVSGVIKTYFRYPYMNRLVGALSIDTESDMARFIAERFTKPLAAAQQAILEQGQREGVFRDIDPMLFHFSLVGACDHLFHARHSLKYAFGIEEITDDLRRRYADHITGILMESILLKP
ncbi:TetR family transcriptional regulator [Stakelama tenebrarum]|uniref:TetR family transcriptional regulator n=1 Tax=Stakelama tenebrarum TaxID=2711215 RepID=A0A6G6Y829_9SPHN|nr:TetR family transcriptional regulator [Sphingosinithalassobacter tenebrarum]QIG81069.1 TetR family transcriptional regulator [Sphingosinithalassobacter tenebrarum]